MTRLRPEYLLRSVYVIHCCWCFAQVIAHNLKNKIDNLSTVVFCRFFWSKFACITVSLRFHIQTPYPTADDTHKIFNHTGFRNVCYYFAQKTEAIFYSFTLIFFGLDSHSFTTIDFQNTCRTNIWHYLACILLIQYFAGINYKWSNKIRDQIYTIRSLTTSDIRWLNTWRLQTQTLFSVKYTSIFLHLNYIAITKQILLQNVIGSSGRFCAWNSSFVNLMNSIGLFNDIQWLLIQ